MAAGAPAGIMLAMTRSITPSKVLLIAERRGTAASAAAVPVRRYRIARLRLEGRMRDPEARFEHLKRVYE